MFKIPNSEKRNAAEGTESTEKFHFRFTIFDLYYGLDSRWYFQCEGMHMKQVGLVFLGLIASAVFYFPLALLIGVIFPNIGLGMLLVCFFVVMPLAFLFGSIVTGYFSYYQFENKWALLVMAPALYSNMLFMFTFDELWLVFLGCLYWYLSSLAGVGLGYFLRGKFAKWRYGD